MQWSYPNNLTVEVVLFSISIYITASVCLCLLFYASLSVSLPLSACLSDSQVTCCVWLLGRPQWPAVFCLSIDPTSTRSERTILEWTSGEEKTSRCHSGWLLTYLPSYYPSWITIYLCVKGFLFHPNRLFYIRRKYPKRLDFFMQSP